MRLHESLSGVVVQGYPEIATTFGAIESLGQVYTGSSKIFDVKVQHQVRALLEATERETADDPQQDHTVEILLTPGQARAAKAALSKKVSMGGPEAVSALEYANNMDELLQMNAKRNTE